MQKRGMDMQLLLKQEKQLEKKNILIRFFSTFSWSEVEAYFLGFSTSLKIEYLFINCFRCRIYLHQNLFCHGTNSETSLVDMNHHLEETVMLENLSK